MSELTQKNPSAALVLETVNLRGGSADRARIEKSLARLLSHLARQTRALATLDEVVITHDGLSPSAQRALVSASDANVRFVRLPSSAGYYQSKNLGFEATSAAVVVFGDSDCWPNGVWLERLLAPFSDPTVSVVSGRTTYRDDVLGQAASALDFLYFEPGGPTRTTLNFYANNVAFRREIFAEHRFQPLAGTYRGHCQVLGMRLHSHGIPIRFEPGARTVHRFPDSWRELVQLRLLRGSDTVSVAPHLARTYLPPAEPLARRRPISAALAVLAARLGSSFGALGHQDLRPLDPARRVARAATVLGLSAVDAIGVLRRDQSALHDGAAPEPVLSYHGDVDALGA